MIRATLDTNVLASAIAGEAKSTSTPGELLRRWHGNAYRLVLSEHLLVELARTLAKPYFRDRMTLAQVERAFRALRRRGQMTTITVTVAGAATHPADDLVLATAVSGAADYLVTGDGPLRGLGSFRGVRIVNPAEFLAILDASPEPRP